MSCLGQSAARNPPAFEQEVHYLHSAVACGLAPGIVELVRARLRHHRFSNHWINHVSDHLQGAVDLVEVQVYERFTSFNEQPAEEDSTDLDRLPQPVCLRVVACGGRLVISGYGYKKYQAYTQDKAVTVGSAYVACDLTIDPAINFSRTSRCESEREVRLLVLATFEKACFTPDHQEVIGPEIVRDICQHNYV